jgi:hypothetical protein
VSRVTRRNPPRVTPLSQSQNQFKPVSDSRIHVEAQDPVRSFTCGYQPQINPVFGGFNTDSRRIFEFWGALGCPPAQPAPRRERTCRISGSWLRSGWGSSPGRPDEVLVSFTARSSRTGSYPVPDAWLLSSPYPHI